MRQVMPIAAGLSSGLALNSFGLLSRTVRGSLRQGAALAPPAALWGVKGAAWLAGRAARGDSPPPRDRKAAEPPN
jgi:hypothetical protein